MSLLFALLVTMKAFVSVQIRWICVSAMLSAATFYATGE